MLTTNRVYSLIELSIAEEVMGWHLNNTKYNWWLEDSDNKCVGGFNPLDDANDLMRVIFKAREDGLCVWFRADPEFTEAHCGQSVYTSVDVTSAILMAILEEYRRIHGNN